MVLPIVLLRNVMLQHHIFQFFTLLSVKWLLTWELEDNESKCQTFSPKSVHGHLQEVPNIHVRI